MLHVWIFFELRCILANFYFYVYKHTYTLLPIKHPLLFALYCLFLHFAFCSAFCLFSILYSEYRCKNFFPDLNPWLNPSLREKCPYLEIFRSVFSRIRTEYEEIHVFQSKWEKIQARKTRNTDTFYAVLVYISHLNVQFIILGIIFFISFFILGIIETEHWRKMGLIWY